MNMIYCPANFFSNTVEGAHCTAHISVQAVAPFASNQRRSIFGAEYQVIMQA